jgi:hypothetical protein
VRCTCCDLVLLKNLKKERSLFLSVLSGGGVCVCVCVKLVFEICSLFISIICCIWKTSSILILADDNWHKSVINSYFYCDDKRNKWNLMCFLFLSHYMKIKILYLWSNDFDLKSLYFSVKHLNSVKVNISPKIITDDFQGEERL